MAGSMIGRSVQNGCEAIQPKIIGLCMLVLYGIYGRANEVRQ